MLKGRKMVYASKEVRVNDFRFVWPRNNSARKYMLLLVTLIGGKVIENPN
jgi:hypothetical protein